MYLADDFRPSAAGLDLDRLDGSRTAAVGLRRDLTIGLANRAWAEAAGFLCGSAGYPDDGTRYLSGLPEGEQAALAAAIGEVARTCQPVSHELVATRGECSRRYRLRIMPLPRGVLVLHHLLEERVGA
ncbi:MAG: hypothetical protein H6742_01395 [Alphaproteobacteria bacterium]|nr:hypothetical protein [Alphaproteobacteria bacterium]